MRFVSDTDSRGGFEAARGIKGFEVCEGLGTVLLLLCDIDAHLDLKD